MIPFVLSSFFNATSAVSGGLYDRSMAGGYVSLSEPENLWTLVNADTCAFTENANRQYPAVDSDCSDVPTGSVVFSIIQACLDVSTWVMYCNDSPNVWTAITLNSQTMKGGATLAGENKLLMIEVDTTNTDGNSDNPTSWLKGTASTAANINYRCDDPAPSGMGKGGSLWICPKAMTERSTMAAVICTKGVSTDSPGCADNHSTLGLNFPDFAPECVINPDPVPFSEMDEE